MCLQHGARNCVNFTSSCCGGGNMSLWCDLFFSFLLFLRRRTRGKPLPLCSLCHMCLSENLFSLPLWVAMLQQKHSRTLLCHNNVQEEERGNLNIRLFLPPPPSKWGTNIFVRENFSLQQQGGGGGGGRGVSSSSFLPPPALTYVRSAEI